MENIGYIMNSCIGRWECREDDNVIIVYMLWLMYYLQVIYIQRLTVTIELKWQSIAGLEMVIYYPGEHVQFCRGFVFPFSEWHEPFSTIGAMRFHMRVEGSMMKFNVKVLNMYRYVLATMKCKRVNEK